MPARPQVQFFCTRVAIEEPSFFAFAQARHIGTVEANPRKVVL
jgi:hypothetical protein